MPKRHPISQRPSNLLDGLRDTAQPRDVSTDPFLNRPFWEEIVEDETRTSRINSELTDVFRRNVDKNYYIDHSKMLELFTIISENEILIHALSWRFSKPPPVFDERRLLKQEYLSKILLTIDTFDEDTRVRLSEALARALRVAEAVGDKGEAFIANLETFATNPKDSTQVALEAPAVAVASGGTKPALELPDEAPEMYPGKKIEEGSTFVRRVYGRYLEAGILFQSDLARLDPALKKRLDNEFAGRRDELRRLVPHDEDRTNRILGSGLVAHSQKMTVAASAMAEKKAVGHRS